MSGAAPASEIDVVVVGAGAAGLAAAGVLRAAGCGVALLEAGGRSGGRAHTIHLPGAAGARFEAGAIWLHETDRNPLARLAERHGIACSPGHPGGRRLFVGGRTAHDAERDEYEREYAAWERACLRAADGPDRPLAEAAPVEGVWRGNIETWEASIIAAADADRLGLHDWRRNRLDDSDLTPPEGLGSLLLQLVGPLAGQVRLGTAVSHLDWSGTDHVMVSGAFGALAARAAIVTVSTGVLAAGGIAFAPALPGGTAQAIGELPMGLLSRLAIPAAGAGRLGLEPGTLLEPRIERPAGAGQTRMFFQAWPDGAPYVVAFYGGSLAWSLCGRPEVAVGRAMDELRHLLGPAVDEALRPAQAFVTGWGEDPLFCGAYSYCPAGGSAARGRLAEPIAGGRLVFAGEACRTDGLAGTVGGALADGERAARIVLAARFGVERAPDLLAADRLFRDARGFSPAGSPV